LTLLKFAPQSASEDVYKVVASAIANAENTSSSTRARCDRQGLRRRGTDRQAVPSSRAGSRFPHPQADFSHHHRGESRPSTKEGPASGSESQSARFRLGITTEWKSRWYADKLYSAYVAEDVAIRKMMTKGMERAGISRVEIERTRDACAWTSTPLALASSSVVVAPRPTHPW